MGALGLPPSNQGGLIKLPPYGGSLNKYKSLKILRIRLCCILFVWCLKKQIYF